MPSSRSAKYCIALEGHRAKETGFRSFFSFHYVSRKTLGAFGFVALAALVTLFTCVLSAILFEHSRFHHCNAALAQRFFGVADQFSNILNS